MRLGLEQGLYQMLPSWGSHALIGAEPPGFECHNSYLLAYRAAPSYTGPASFDDSPIKSIHDTK